MPSPLGERLMIPVQYLEELKTAPVDKVDFVATFTEVMCSAVSFAHCWYDPLLISCNNSVDVRGQIHNNG